MLHGKSLDVSISIDVSENKCPRFKNVIEYLAYLAVVMVNIVLAYIQMFIIRVNYQKNKSSFS